jgi:superfamily II DNA/RNA helicase
VATDLAARGLDITDVANVIHYHLPVDEAAWTHRNGRTARMNATGTIWVITSEADNIPEYITFDREYQPKQTEKPMTGTMMATIYLNAGKKEKISKGDVAGYIAASGETAPDEIGKIAVHDHHSVVAVPENKVKATVKALSDKKLKGKRVRVSIVEP